MEKNNVMVPTNDYIFNRIFGHVGNEEITKALIHEVLGKDIQKIELSEKAIDEKDLEQNKKGIFNVEAKIDDENFCNIEMKAISNDKIEKGIMFYWNKLYCPSVRVGGDYSKVNKKIVIMIANFELDTIKQIPRYHTKWEVKEKEFSKVILTNVLEIHIVELPKMMRQLKNNEISEDDKLTQWLRFIINPDEIKEKELKENENLRKAKEELEKIKQDKHEQYLARLRLKQILKAQTKEQHDYKREIKEEKNKKIIQAILNLNKMKMKLEDICQVVNLSVDEVEAIINTY